MKIIIVGTGTVGGILGRLAGKKCNVKKVIYQAHGFHFYKGAPKKNWLLYYPIEKWLAHYTDALITITQEDYELAKTKLRLRKGGNVYYVPGVGVDTLQFGSGENLRTAKRMEINIPKDAFVLISAGELNVNKNNKVIISALEKLKDHNVHYLVCGIGPEEQSLKQQVVDAGLQDTVHFLGYRKDVKELYAMADCFVMPSFREGLSRSIMEAMASGLPCVVSKIRGNTDLVEDGQNGFTCPAADANSFADALKQLVDDQALRMDMRKNNLEKIKSYDISVVEQKMREIYADVFM